MKLSFDPKKMFFFTISILFLVSLLGCKMANREYSTHEQWDLARSRVDLMKEHLGFSFTLENDTFKAGEPIIFKAHFTNETDSPIVIRIPQQTGVLDLDTINTTLEYSIISLDRSITMSTPLMLMVTPQIFGYPVLASEFETIEKRGMKDVKLEIPNTVFIKNGEQWNEAKIPPGQYLVNMVYENFQVGYEVDRKDEIRVVDVSAWVGKIEGDPVNLTILP